MKIGIIDWSFADVHLVLGIGEIIQEEYLDDDGNSGTVEAFCQTGTECV